MVAIPDGRYSCEDKLDDDGFRNQPIKIRARIRITGSRAENDFKAQRAAHPIVAGTSPNALSWAQIYREVWLKVVVDIG